MGEKQGRLRGDTHQGMGGDKEDGINIYIRSTVEREKKGKGGPVGKKMQRWSREEVTCGWERQ